MSHSLFQIILEGEQHKEGAAHAFEEATFKKFTYCKYCSQFIWGLTKQGMKPRNQPQSLLYLFILHNFELHVTNIVAQATAALCASTPCTRSV